MNEILWLNKETLKERWLHPYFCFIDPSLWVKVPDGATFATGDKDDFVFRKDGWYYDNQKCEWVETNVLLKHFPEYKHIKLFWVKSDVKDGVLSNNFTVAWEQVFGEKFVDSVIKAVKQNKAIVSKAVKQNKDNSMKNDMFTLERLLGCEVLFKGRELFIEDVVNSYSVEVGNRNYQDCARVSDLTFFTEDGDELTFDEYVQLYYPEG